MQFADALIEQIRGGGVKISPTDEELALLRQAPVHLLAVALNMDTRLEEAGQIIQGHLHQKLLDGGYAGEAEVRAGQLAQLAVEQAQVAYQVV